MFVNLLEINHVLKFLFLIKKNCTKLYSSECYNKDLNWYSFKEEEIVNHWIKIFSISKGVFKIGLSPK